MLFNGINPCDLDQCVSIAKEIDSGIPPRTVRTVQMLRGTRIAGIENTARTYTVRINIAAKSRSKAWYVAQRLAAWACTNEPKELIPTRAPCRAYTAILESASSPEFSFGFGVVEFRFLIPRPFSHSVTETMLNLPGGGAINTCGDLPARLSVKQTLAGAASSWELKHNGKTFVRLVNAFQAGNIIRIDMTNRSVHLNSLHAEALVDFSITDWNEAILGATKITSSDTGPMEIRWRDEWT